MMVEGQDIAAYALGGTGFTVLVAWALRKVWQQLTSATADGEKAKADAMVFENMRKELERLSKEIQELKLEHKKEKKELEERVGDLETKVARMSMKLGSIRIHAVDAYAALTSKECKECPAISSAIEHVKRILEEE